MGFLLRVAFWFSLVLLAIPMPRDAGGGPPPVGALEALGAAREAIDDVSGLCARRPEVCETGRAAVLGLGVRAREGARIAYELLDERVGEPDASLPTGTVPARE